MVAPIRTKLDQHDDKSSGPGTATLRALEGSAKNPHQLEAMSLTFEEMRTQRCDKDFPNLLNRHMSNDATNTAAALA